MSNRYLNPSPLPFENHAALSLFAEERPSVDVVEPAAAPRTGVHPDRVVATARPRGFVAPTLFDVTGHDAGAEARRDDLDDADHDADDVDRGDDTVNAGDRDRKDDQDDSDDDGQSCVHPPT